MEVSKVSKNKLLKVFTVFSVLGLLSLAILASPASALISQNTTSWFSTSDTNNSCTIVGDVNNDTVSEIVTAGYYNDGIRWNAQLAVWNASTLTAEKVFNWNWNDTQISSVAIGDVNGDGQIEIVTGGSYFDGTRWNAQIVVFNGTSLAPLNTKSWFWTSDTEISSVAVANITGGTGLDIVTGGAFFDGARWNSQLVILNGVTLTPSQVLPWFFTGDTLINSVAVGNITGGTSLSIVVGGAYFDGTRYVAQLIVLNAATLTWQNGLTWYWAGDTIINSVVLANVTGGSSLSVIEAGSNFDGTRNNAQVVVFDGTTLAWQNGFAWFTTSNTQLNSITAGNYSGGTSLDIITGGAYNDGVRNNAQLVHFNGATMAIQSVANWFVTNSTTVNSVGIVNLGLGNRIVAGGSYFDNIRSNAQLTIWG